MSDPKITEEQVQRIEDALEERKNKIDRRATEESVDDERRRSPGRRESDQK